MAVPAFLAALGAAAAAPLLAEAELTAAAKKAYELPGHSGVLVCSVAILLANWALALSCKQRDTSAGGPHTPERLKVFARWAQQQVEESPAENHRQVLDDVIFTFATYAQRLEKEPGRAARRAAVLRLRVLIEFLETPSVNRALRSVNWSWLREWDQRLLEPREARMRCTVVFPTICRAAEVQQSERLGGRPCATFGGLAYLAGWCIDFLERPDTRSFLAVLEPSSPRAPMSPDFTCITAGALYSESSEDEESPIRRTSRNALDQSPCYGLSDGTQTVRRREVCGLLRRSFEGQEHCWDSADATEAMVRGAHYLSDRVKVPSKSEMLELVHVDLLKASEELVHYSESPKGKIPQLRSDGDSRFFFTVNFRLHPIHFAITWAVPEDAEWLEQPEGVLFKRFLEMSDEERNKRVKVLPKVVEGPWLVKKSMPDRPGVVGRKLSMNYFQQRDHLEISLNCISSPAGRRIVQVLTGGARHFSIEVFIIIEGQSPDELPERILGGVAVFNGDLDRIPVV